ncbi:unnamed protein product [Orchesella dallaii]|uniref:Metalloendopeptidase n=1 Tax=Orchesella dallaii TaxID=48710 RepID=A0ABP1RYY4_9HEXA
MVSVLSKIFVLMCFTQGLLATYIQRGEKLGKWSLAAKDKLVILKAMESISTQTCVTFIVHTNEKDFLTIHGLHGHRHCWSASGRTTGEQIMHLGMTPEKNCVEHGTVLYFLMRVLGFELEHRRPDRDDYIEINWNNIKYVKFPEFGKIPSSRFIYDVKKEPYDYFSLMHLNATKFAKDPNILVISPKFVDKTVIGQRDRLSEGDVRKIRDAYNCQTDNLSNSGEILMHVSKLWFLKFLLVVLMMGSKL